MRAWPKLVLPLLLLFVVVGAELDAHFFGAYVRRSPVEGCPQSNCIKKSHDDAKKCITSIYNSPGFQPCKRDRNFWLLSRIYGELSYLWHKSMEKCWTADDSNRIHRFTHDSDWQEENSPDEEIMSFPPPCMARVKKQVQQCNKQLEKCPRYKECFNRLDNQLAMGYEADVVKRLNREIKTCFKKHIPHIRDEEEEDDF